VTSRQVRGDVINDAQSQTPYSQSHCCYRTHRSYGDDWRIILILHK